MISSLILVYHHLSDLYTPKEHSVLSTSSNNDFYYDNTVKNYKAEKTARYVHTTIPAPEISQLNFWRKIIGGVHGTDWIKWWFALQGSFLIDFLPLLILLDNWYGVSHLYSAKQFFYLKNGIILQFISVFQIRAKVKTFFGCSYCCPLEVECAPWKGYSIFNGYFYSGMLIKCVKYLNKLSWNWKEGLKEARFKKKK